MKFYTNVHQIGDHILVRGYENRPTIFIPSREKSSHTTIEGKYLSPVKPGTIKETRDFIRRYEGVDNFQIYGMNTYRYSWIYDNFPKDRGIDYDFDLLNHSLPIARDISYFFNS